MAIDFFEIGKAGAGRAKRIDYSKALDPLAQKIQTRVKESKAKTEALINSMPQGVAIDKVPEELRGQVTDFLAKNKQEYVNASRVIASGIRPTDQRYIDAMATINGVNSKFQNLSNQLEDIALKRQSALDNRDHSNGAIDTQIDDHESLANGSLYSTFTINDDGGFNYVSSSGETKKWNNYSNTFQKSGVGQEAFTIISEQAQKDGAYGNKFNKDKYKNLFRELRQKLKTDGSRDFLFSDETFLLEQTGLEEKDLGSDKYKNAVNKLVNEGNFEELMDKYQVYAIEKLRELHGDSKKAYDARQSSGGRGRDTLPVNYGVGYITKNSANILLDDIKNKRDFVSLNLTKTYKFDEKKQQYFEAGTDPKKYVSNKFLLATDGIWQQGYRIGEYNTEIIKAEEEAAKATLDKIQMEKDKKPRKNTGSFIRNIFQRD